MNHNNLKSKALSSVMWKLLERIGAQLVTLIVSIVLARLLDPSDYGVVSIVVIFFTFANVLITGGLNTALIQKKNADRDDYSTVLHVSVLLSVFIYGVLFFTAPIISRIYEKDILVPIIRVMGLALPINAVKAIWCAYISSNLQFRKFFFSTIGGIIISASVGITLALKGAGAWALVAQQMTNILIGTFILIFTTRIHIVFKISFSKLKNLFNYGWKVFVSSIIGTIYNEIVPLVIGVKYSSADLSFYTKGKSFPSLINTITTNTLSSVMFPTMVKFQDDKGALLRYTRLFIRLASFMAFPMMLGFLATADDFVLIVLTEKWLPASKYIKIYCIAFMFDMIHVGNCETIKAMGRSGIYLIMELVKKIFYFITIGLFLIFTKTPETLALAFIVCTFIAIIVNSIPNQRLLGYKIRYQIMDLLPNLITSSIMCGCVLLVGSLGIDNTVLSFGLKVLTGAIVYFTLNLVIKNESLVYLWNFVKDFVKSHKRP